MLTSGLPSPHDPRSKPEGSPEGGGLDDDLRPTVANSTRPLPPWLAIVPAVALGAVVFLFLASHRTREPQVVDETPSDLIQPASAQAQPPAFLGQIEDAARGRGAPQPPPASPPPPPPPQAAPFVTSLPFPPQLLPERGGRKNIPSLVVDLSDFSSPPKGQENAPGSPVPGQQGSALNGDEQFAARLGANDTDRVRATFLRNKSMTVPQGALVPAVLEVALNSDLPGPVRAVVSSDVRGFDGTEVLIPRGSRLIGQYRSGISAGASRAFVIWTRLLRPDGASVQLASPATDTLGRAGLTGSVDRHFFERFGGAALLSVVNVAATAASDQPETQVVIGSSSNAGVLATSSLSSSDIAPTIKVPQGTQIRVFVARDLDFSPVEPPR